MRAQPGVLGEPLMMLLTGPVGAGKSTVALAIADRFREIGSSAAVIDLDLVYRMARQRDGFDEIDVWRMARRGAAAIADVFFTSGLEAVVVEGGIFSQEAHDDLREHLSSAVQGMFITLDVSYEETLSRTQEDPSPGRVTTRDPKTLQRLYGEFEAALPFLRESSLVVGAGRRTPSELAELMVEEALARNEARCGETV